MKIAIISDTHDNLKNIEIFFEKIKDIPVEKILHLGDVCLPSTLEFIYKHFRGEIYLSLGNGDEDFSSFKKDNVFIFEKMGKVELLGKKIGFTHFPDLANQMANEGGYDFVFHGHTHFPVERKKGETKIINPGNLSGTFFMPSFAILDLKNQSILLKILYL